MRGMVLAALVTAGPALAQSTADTLADTVRARGHPCAMAVAPGEDAAASRPHEPVWLPTCSDGRYRGRYPGDTAPQVERLS